VAGVIALRAVESAVLPEHRRKGVGSELVRALADHAREPGHDDVNAFVEEWLRHEATRPEGSFAAPAGGVPVGYPGLIEHARGSATAEHGLTVVRRDHRGRGVGRPLKQAQRQGAARGGVVQLATWTQKGNEAMQALNRSLGYVDKSKVLTYQGPLP
jgi:GNAT superfamily N-acetyltransferase